MSDQFSGYDLESGFLYRVRQWRDAMPVLALVPALRVAGSPTYVGWGWLVVLAGGWLNAQFWNFSFADLLAADETGNWALSKSLGAWQQWLAIVAIVLIAILPAMIVSRAGACYAAGRFQSFSQHACIAFGHVRQSLVSLILTLGIVIGLASVIAIGGLVGRWRGSVGSILAEGVGVLLIPVAILAGLIAAGAVVAVPLALTAMVIEKQSDALDSLSRGYEYLYRRPIHLLFFSLVSLVLLAIAWVMATAVSAAAILIGEMALRIGSGAEAPKLWVLILARLPLAVTLTAGWGQIGAIYLLLRQAANDQEIEDIAVSEVDLRPADMPTLRTSSDSSPPQSAP